MTNTTGAAGPAWRKSSYSGGGNQCVEVAALPGGRVAVRDSQNPGAGTRVFSAPAWECFTGSLKHAGA
jgi:Domain of unknown function (DUF397)